MIPAATDPMEANEGRTQAGGATSLTGLLPIVVSFVISFLVIPGAAAGDLGWFVTRWSEAAFVLVLLIRSILLSTQCDYDQAGPSASDHFRALALMLILVVAVYDRTAWHAADHSPWWSVAGIVLCLTAAALDVLAVNSFRRNRNPTFITTQARTLVTEGIYRRIQHPIYTGLLLAALGLPLILRSLWGALLALLVIAPLLAVRIRGEEARLRALFGDEYRAYAARTRRFIPYVV